MPEYDIELSEEVPPDPAATIETLGALGYSTNSAVADLIDNSIYAGATQIDVVFHWDGADSWCAIADDGQGMTTVELKHAMTIGSRDPLLPRDEADLGRFGFGLKAASFSQCRELTVGSRKSKRPVAFRTWDLECVRAEGRWLLLKSPPQARQLVEQCQGPGPGTVVLWRRLTGDLIDEGARVDDKRAHQHFLQRVASLERHLAMTFGRYLLRGHKPLRICINGVPVDGWDPFLSDHPATQRMSPEKLRYRGETVNVSPFVLPHRSKLTEVEYEQAGGPHGWNDQQGFYVYRSDRLIQAGEWFARGHTKHAGYDLARIAIDVPASLDRHWALDVKKSSVRPPGPLASDLTRIALVTRERAREVYRHRGALVGPRAEKPAEPVWHQRRRHGESIMRINRKHPLIEGALEKVGRERQALVDLISLIEATLPVPLLPGRPKREASVTVDIEASENLMRLAERLYNGFLQDGMTRQAARDRLLKIEPFNHLPSLVDDLVGSV